MGELEPDDSRDVTNTTHHAPGGETPTGAREDEARRLAGGDKPAPSAAGSGLATEGDSREHPDRFADSIPEGEAGSRGEQAGKGDRWHQAAEQARRDDGGDNLGRRLAAR